VENFGVEQCRHSSYPFRVELRGEPGAGLILEGERRLPAGLSFRLVASKLQPPPPRPGIVARRALVDRLLTSPSAPIICVVAPPGYGKTTVLAQWSERKGPRVAWVSVDHRDNDAMVLLTYLAGALDRVEPIDPTLFRTLAGPGVSVLATVVPRFLSAVAAMTGPVALVLDHVEALENQDCLDAVAELALGLPTGWQLAGCPGGGCSRCCSWSCSGS
jgi:ATP/maltotriose-dependent transcriptional regulator MalT